MKIYKIHGLDMKVGNRYIIGFIEYELIDVFESIVGIIYKFKHKNGHEYNLTEYDLKIGIAKNELKLKEDLK